MTPVKRRAAALAAPVLLALSLTACGGGAGSDAPSDASVEDFCTAFLDIDAIENGGDIKEWGSNLADVGTPEDLSDDQRKGFEVFIDATQDVDEDASLEDIEDPSVSDDDKDAADSFIEYASTTCAEQQLPDDSAS